MQNTCKRRDAFQGGEFKNAYYFDSPRAASIRSNECSGAQLMLPTVLA
jgi:hypothetical protein